MAWWLPRTTPKAPRGPNICILFRTFVWLGHPISQGCFRLPILRCQKQGAARTAGAAGAAGAVGAVGAAGAAGAAGPSGASGASGADLTS